MSKKKDGSVGPVFTLATTGGVLLLRKLLGVVWARVTGKQPPTDLTDPRVTLPEAIGWAVFTAIIVETARFGIVRATGHRPEPAVGEGAADAETD